MAQWGIPVLVLFACGCVSPGPEKVFREATKAFAEGEVRRGARHFSQRLLAARPLPPLATYYSDPQKQKGIAYLLKKLNFALVDEAPYSAVAEITWTTGRTELVFFVRENGDWKLDLPPGEVLTSSEPDPSGPSFAPEGIKEATPAKPQPSPQ